jgi:hypothetical protein
MTMITHRSPTDDDTHSTDTSSVRRLPVPTEIRELSTLARVDYADTFLVDVGASPQRSALEWARAVLDDAPLGTRTRLLAGWSALGLKLAVTDPAAMLGWRVRRTAPDHVLLFADGRLGLSGQLLFMCAPGELWFATFVRLDGRASRLAWAGVERVHDPVVRSLLAHAGHAHS